MRKGIPDDLCEVFEDIRRAFGIHDDKLKLKYTLKPTVYNARFYNDKNSDTVIVYQGLYELIKAKCIEKGLDFKSALAFIIGHEMAHAKFNHSSSSGFAYSNKSLKNEDTKKESDADLYGCYYAHLAGYRSKYVYDDVLAWIYNANNFDIKLRGYKPLDERKVSFDKTFKLLQDEVFDKVEYANKLFKKGDYINARDKYLKIVNNNSLSGFRNAALYNNIAVCNMYRMIKNQTIPTKYKGYQFPFVHDSSPAESLRGGNQSERNKTLDSTAKYLGIAKELDPDYEPVIANKYWLSLLYFIVNDETDVKKLESLTQIIDTDKQIAKNNKDKLLSLYYTIIWVNNKSSTALNNAKKYSNLTKKVNNLKLLEK